MNPFEFQNLYAKKSLSKEIEFYKTYYRNNNIDMPGYVKAHIASIESTVVGCSTKNFDIDECIKDNDKIAYDKEWNKITSKNKVKKIIEYINNLTYDTRMCTKNMIDKNKADLIQDVEEKKCVKSKMTIEWNREKMKIENIENIQLTGNGLYIFNMKKN
jgi:hypothetical protein